MPTYEYLCEQCGYRLKKLQEVSAEPMKQCPKCGGVTRRLIGGVGLVFKGSGFYTTDYKNVSPDATCCGRTERCEKPPYSDDGACKR